MSQTVYLSFFLLSVHIRAVKITEMLHSSSVNLVYCQCRGFKCSLKGQFELPTMLNYGIFSPYPFGVNTNVTDTDCMVVLQVEIFCYVGETQFSVRFDINLWLMALKFL